MSNPLDSNPLRPAATQPSAYTPLEIHRRALDVIKKSGTTTQLAVIVFLVVVLLVLVVLTFSPL